MNSLLEENYKNKMQELESEFNLKAKTLKLERDRENEEYNYKLKWDRELANNKWEDEKIQREKVFADSNKRYGNKNKY